MTKSLTQMLMELHEAFEAPTLYELTTMFDCGAKGYAKVLLRAATYIERAGIWRRQVRELQLVLRARCAEHSRTQRYLRMAGEENRELIKRLSQVEDALRLQQDVSRKLREERDAARLRLSELRSGTVFDFVKWRAQMRHEELPEGVIEP